MCDKFFDKLNNFLIEKHDILEFHYETLKNKIKITIKDLIEELQPENTICNNNEKACSNNENKIVIIVNDDEWDIIEE